MKKFFALAAIVALVSVTACNSDDDSEPEMTCRTCTIDLLGTPLTSEYCDNGDGTIEVTFEGQTETTDQEGVTLAQFITGLEQAGATCN